MPEARRRVAARHAREAAAPPPRGRSNALALTAAAALINSPSTPLKKVSVKSEDWQAKAWAFFDDVGEFRNGAGWVSNGLSRVNLLSAVQPRTEGDNPTPISEVLQAFDEQVQDGITPDPLPLPREVLERAQDLVAVMAGGPIGQSQMLATFGLHLTVAGESWLIVEPATPDPLDDELATWIIVADKEVKGKTGGGGLQVIGDDGQWRDVHPKALVIRCFRRHPAARAKADSPVRAVLSTLAEVQLLSEHVIATATSRLAGSGLLLLNAGVDLPPTQIPQNVLDAVEAGTLSPNDIFAEVFYQSMTVPVADRGVASAVAPLLALIPEGVDLDKAAKHLRFSTPFDENVLELRDNAIRRLALGLDMPPEVLLGVGGMNHWGAWQVEETGIKLHLEPLAELVCHALTVHYLVTALKAEFPEQAKAIEAEVMVWYDTTDLVSRPDKSAQVKDAYDRGEASGDALRTHSGLDSSDAASEEEQARRILLGVAEATPKAAAPILVALKMLDPKLGAVIQAAVSTAVAEAAAEGFGGGGEEQVSEPAEGPPPEGPPSEPEPASVRQPVEVAVVAACEGIVLRALERAGSRLRAASMKGRNGGSAAFPCERLDRVHTIIRTPSLYEDLGKLTSGSWERVEEVAARYFIPADALQRTLEGYTHDLLARGEPCDLDTLYLAIHRPVPSAV